MIAPDVLLFLKCAHHDSSCCYILFIAYMYTLLKHVKKVEVQELQVVVHHITSAASSKYSLALSYSARSSSSIPSSSASEPTAASISLSS
jgi:hypothetical protein